MATVTLETGNTLQIVIKAITPGHTLTLPEGYFIHDNLVRDVAERGLKK